MKLSRLVVSLAFSCSLGFTSYGQTNVLNVPGDANIFAAGRQTPLVLSGGGGVLPSRYSFAPANSNQFTFDVSGAISADTITYWTAEGGPYFMNISSLGGISGVKSDSGSLFLMGVFLTDAAVATPAPPILDFRSTGLGTNFSELSPLIGQTFYIGAGINPQTGLKRKYNAPANATRVFLGVPDAFGYATSPSAYGDNSGSLSVTVNVTNLVSPSLSLDLYAGLFLTGNVGKTYLVQYSTGIAPNNWTDLTNITLPSSPYFFLDLTAPARTSRFYRVTAVP